MLIVYMVSEASSPFFVGFAFFLHFRLILLNFGLFGVCIYPSFFAAGISICFTVFYPRLFIAYNLPWKFLK